MNRKPQQNASVDDVLYEFAIAQDRPDAQLLKDFIGRFPQHARALTEFAVSLALEAYRDPPDEETEDLTGADNAALSRAMSLFQNRLYEVRKELQVKAASGSVGNPFEALGRSGLDQFANRINANRLFVTKLRDCQIDKETMTPGFQRKVAEELQVPLDVVVAHFGRQSQMRVTLRFKSSGKPNVSAKQSFVEAVRKSDLTREQQEWLLAL